MDKKPTKKTQAPGRRPPREAPVAAPQTKKQIAMGRRDAAQNRVVLFSVGALGLVIVAILVVGLIREAVLRPAQAVAMVNGTKIRQDDYQIQLTYRRYVLHNSALQLEAQLQSLDKSEPDNQFLISFYQQQLTQTQTLLSAAPETTLDEAIEDELIAEKAAEANISVTAADLDATIQEDLRLAYSPSTQEPITDTESAATPTAVPQKELKRFYDQVLADMQLSERQFRSVVRRQLLRTKVEELLASQVLTTGLVAEVQLIQSLTETAATDALQRIESGEDFAAVAKEVSADSQSKDNGGTLGWVTKEQLEARFGADLAELAFTHDVGQLVLTPSNDKYYVVLVTARDENGPLPEAVISERRDSALADWLSAVQESPDVKIERLLSAEQIPPDPFVSAGIP